MTLIIDTSYPPAPPLPTEKKWPPQGKWTYEEFRRLPDDGRRYEIIEGVLYMSPAPRTKHQICITKLAYRLERYNEKQHAGLVLVAPVDVYFSTFTTVEPDIVFVMQSRLSIVQEEKIVGAPDLAVEVLSPSTAQVDRGKKFQLYAQAGVGEYWIVDPEMRIVELFVLRKGAYELLGKYGVGELVRSEILSGFKVNVEEICPQ